MKLLSKYLRTNIALVVGVFLLSSLLLYFEVNKTLIHELDEELGEIKSTLVKYIANSGRIPKNSVLYAYQLGSQEVGDSSAGIHFETVSRYVLSKAGPRDFRQLTFYVELNGRHYRLSIEKQIEGLTTMTQNLIKLSLLTIFLVTVVLMFINRLVFNSLWRPFYQTLAIMRNFELNKKNTLDFPKTNIEEFNYMNDILKRTSQKAGEDYIALKEFTENASHELQTPLSIISSKLDLLIQDEKLSARQNQTIVSAFTALKKMSRLNQSLLLLAKIGNKQYSDVEEIHLKEKLNEKLGQFHELWLDQHIEIKTGLQEAFILMNPDLNDILINNLLSNATKHNVTGGFINIQLSPGNLLIANSGVDIPIDQTKIFKRFYKSDQSSDSNGLGLSIIKQICDVSNILITYQFASASHNFNLSWNTGSSNDKI